ncbi:23S rRNA (uracil(1939)-C(5))-methyltransferase RlmD [Candidatus Woesearchaeota archaeon]|nr:MAG: 23S rRNA (uracil(1939)-C(5))-methyltransferase RlmD [Candidatus Woesearchaeota archaeon]
MPECEYFGRCGGCSTQHLPYKAQLENKKRFVLHLLQRVLDKVAEPKIYSGPEYHYRNRMDFVFCNKGLGLRKRRKFDKIIPIKHCKISSERINELLKEVWDWYEANKSTIEPFQHRKALGTLKYAVIRATLSGDSSISFIMNEASSHLREHVELVKEFASKTTANNVIVGYVPRRSDLSIAKECFPVKGRLELEECLQGKRFLFHSQAFFQTNSHMASELVGYCYQVMNGYPTTQATLVDLFGGVGSFGICLGELFKEVLIIDNASESIECAAKNLSTNNIKGNAIAADASVLGKLNLSPPLYMIVDPPRSGMHRKVIARVIETKPDVLLYVSCNPKQLAKELPSFSKYYTIKSLAIFDMFPHTPHVEVVVELLRK